MADGEGVGFAVGTAVGLADGEGVGFAVGFAVGLLVGEGVGCTFGSAVGLAGKLVKVLAPMLAWLLAGITGG